MNLFKKYKSLWTAGLVIVLAILFIIYFSQIMKGVETVWNAFSALTAGAMLAFILNLIMDPAQRLFSRSKSRFLKDHASGLAIAAAFLGSLLIIVLILAVVIPNLVSAVQMLTKVAPQYIAQAQSFVTDTLQKYPVLAKWLTGLNLDWKQILESIGAFLTKGTVMDSTVSVVSSALSGAVNSIIVIIFASYVLSDKGRFVRLYYMLTNLWMSPSSQGRLTRNLRIINQSFKSYIGGMIIEAGILSVMCTVGMLILQMPYATMVGVLVGVINMIPMIGAFIGGAIGAFLIFTISPMKCLIFIVFLCVIQEIESNVFFPRVVGNKVGLPGIYVMMTIVVGGSLFGVTGMVLGVPVMASIYKIARIYLLEAQEKRQKRAGDLKQADNTAAVVASLEAFETGQPSAEKKEGLFEAVQSWMSHLRKEAVQIRQDAENFVDHSRKETEENEESGEGKEGEAGRENKDSEGSEGQDHLASSSVDAGEKKDQKTDVSKPDPSQPQK